MGGRFFASCFLGAGVLMLAGCETGARERAAARGDLDPSGNPLGQSAYHRQDPITNPESNPSQQPVSSSLAEVDLPNHPGEKATVRTALDPLLNTRTRPLPTPTTGQPGAVRTEAGPYQPMTQPGSTTAPAPLDRGSPDSSRSPDLLR